MTLMVYNNHRKVENELQDINIYWWINFMQKIWWCNIQTSFCLFFGIIISPKVILYLIWYHVEVLNKVK
jgi:hypothetical protein